MYSIHRFAHHRPHLAIAILIGILVGLALPSHWQWLTRALMAWNVGVWLYLMFIGWLILGNNHVRVRIIAEQEENNAIAVLAILSTSAVISLAAIVFELAASRDLAFDQRMAHYLFTAATVLGSWLLVGILFAFHYAHMFYHAPVEKRPLAFPEPDLHPDYWDFLYFSLTIAVAAQTSDIIIMSRSMRKVVLAQSVLSFLFNAAILGLSINIAAGVVGA